MIRLITRGSERGSAVVEFAIVLPLLVYLLIGLIDVGRYMYFGIVAAHAARSGAQYGAQNVYTAADNTGIQHSAVADGQSLSTWHVTTAVSCQINSGNVPCPANNVFVPGTLVYYLQVTVTGTFTPLVAYPGIPSSVPITSTATMRLGSQ